MDIGDSINALENSLRDLIEVVLSTVYGDAWWEQLGVSEARLETWKSRLAEEPKRRPGGKVEQRLLYYSEFYDVVTIILKNWEHGFNDCFEDKKRFKVYADRLLAFRNPDAHSRALLPFEQHLVLGMTGELRQEITIYLSRSVVANEREYFPRIEELRDNFGNRAVGASISVKYCEVETGLTLRVGSSVRFVGRAWDPDGDPLTWAVRDAGRLETLVELQGQEFDSEWHLGEANVNENVRLMFSLRSPNPYHRHGLTDDFAAMRYRVMPQHRP